MKKYYVLAAIAVFALTAVKLKFFSSATSKSFKQGKEKSKPAIPVGIFVVGEEKMEDIIHANGTILANEQAELRVESSGRIVYLNLPEGKLVQKGDLLLRLNDAEIRAQLQKIIAKLKLSAGTELRQRKLLEERVISHQEYEIALSDLMSLQADSLYFQTQLAKSELRAPFTGYVGIREVSQGSYITPSTTVALIHQTNPVKIEFSLPERYAGLFGVGDIVRFKAEGIDDTSQGRISVKDPSVELSNRSIRYRALSDNSKGLLSPGAFVRVELSVKANSNKLFVPTEAIVPVAKGNKIFYIRNGQAWEKLIETGIRTEDHVQVLSGLAAGDSIVVNGNFQLKDGMNVKIPKKEVHAAMLKSGFKK